MLRNHKFNFISYFTSIRFRIFIADIYAFLVVFVLPLNSAVNPLLYTFTTPKYRNQVLLRGWNKLTSRKLTRNDGSGHTGSGSNHGMNLLTWFILLLFDHRIVGLKSCLWKHIDPYDWQEGDCVWIHVDIPDQLVPTDMTSAKNIQILICHSTFFFLFNSNRSVTKFERVAKPPNASRRRPLLLIGAGAQIDRKIF